MAANHGWSDAMKVAALVLKYEALVGCSVAKSAAREFATLGIVFGSYQRCGFGVLPGSRRRFWTSITCRFEFADADSIFVMKAS